MATRLDNSGSASAGDDLRARLDYDDGRLLAECEVHTSRAGGPGGQHGNKTSSAVRLRHLPSGLVTKAAESRLQHQNKVRALRRLREALAVHVRRPLPDKIDWPENVHIADRNLKLAANNPSIHHVLGLVLDALSTCNGKIADAAACLGITSSSLTRLLSGHHTAWAEANRIRQEVGLPPLRT